MKAFTAPAIITKMTTMADNTLRLQVDCQEMPPGDEAIILASRNKYGWFAFKEGDPLKEEDLPDIPLPIHEKGEKTLSQRLRSVLYVAWEQKGKKDMYNQPCDSEAYYRQVLEKLISSYKEKLV